MTSDDLVSAARAWRDEDPDPDTRAEAERLLEGDGAGPDLDGLRDRFGASLAFGTAGLRGEMGAGPNRMNRVTVMRATAGLARYLADTGHAGQPVIVGFDARHGSATFAADAAAVLAGAGFPVRLADRSIPTPVLAFGVRQVGACAGVQVTASHNPPRDNGYKVYLGDGAQIVPPADAEIAARIDAVGPLASVELAPDGDPRVARVGAGLIEEYVAAAVGAVPPRSSADGPGVRVVYTPLHGVGRDVLLAVFARAGFPAPAVVAGQSDPDPDFPTVAFPNPEEPGALDLALGLAVETRADVVLANDPDGDRLAVAVPTGSGDQWRALTGDEIGILLADWLLERDSGADRLVVTTVVSSSMLGRLAEARGVAFAETLTGFKWVVRPALERPELRFVYGYEEALGSCVGTLVRDKDGITAALAFADLVTAEKQRGRSVLDRLDDLARELGVHATAQRSIPFEGLDGMASMQAAVDGLADAPPTTLVASVPVTEVEDLRRGGRLPPTEGIVLRAEGMRLVVRPSGTEPKLKCYAEAVVPVPGERAEDLAAARADGAARVAALLDAAVQLVG
jgi:phosphomannomutase